MTFGAQRGIKHALTNIGSLATIQAANAVSPLIIYPFVLAVVGSKGYTDIAFAEAVAFFLLTFVLYSFEIDGVVMAVGLSADGDNERISKVYSAILLIRISFYFFGLCFTEIVVFLIDPRLCLLVLEWSLVSLCYAIQPNWLYQAMERNLPLAVVVLISRLGAVATILLTVRHPHDYVIVPGIIGLWYFAGATVTASYAARCFQLTLKRPPLHELRNLIWHGKEVFSEQRRRDALSRRQCASTRPLRHPKQRDCRILAGRETRQGHSGLHSSAQPILLPAGACRGEGMYEAVGICVHRHPRSPSRRQSSSDSSPAVSLWATLSSARSCRRSGA